MNFRLKSFRLSLADFARLFRLPNLFIIIFTQYLLQYLLIIPAFKSASIHPELKGFPFFLLVFSTVLIAAGGYVINDVEDRETDKLNKAEKVIIGNKLTHRQAITLYFIILITGFLISFYLANYVKNIGLVLLYPAAAGLLWLYSKYLKKMPFWGNFTVAVFCAFVPGIIWFAERKGFAALTEISAEPGANLAFLLTGYLVFAFISTLVREIVKDLEDMEGDRLTGCRTLPVVFGVKTARNAAAMTALILLIALTPFYCWLYQAEKIAGLVFCSVAIFLPLAWIFKAILTAKEKNHFTRISRQLKFLMIAGLIMLILVWKF